MKYDERRIFIINDLSFCRIIPLLAEEIGLNESIILLQIEYWISICPNDEQHIKDGRKWTWQSIRDMRGKSFPFWSIATINRTVKSLENQKLIITATYNRFKYDKTRWFALNFDGLQKLKSITVKNVHESETRSAQNETGVPSNHISQGVAATLFQNETGSNQNETGSAQFETTIPESTTENTTKNTTTTAKGGFKKVSSSILESIKRNGEKDRHKKTADSSVTVESEMSNGLIFDSALKDWTTTQRQRALKILKDVPDKQVILDELNSAVKKGTVKQIWRYLTTLVRKYQQDEFVPTSDLPEHRVKSKPKRVSVKDCPLCPLCDKRGLIKFVDERTGQFETVICCHDAVKIEAMRNGRRIEN